MTTDGHFCNNVRHQGGSYTISPVRLDAWVWSSAYQPKFAASLTVTMAMYDYKVAMAIMVEDHWFPAKYRGSHSLSSKHLNH